MAWNLRSWSTAEPSAESPFDQIKLIFLAFLDWAGVTLPDKDLALYSVSTGITRAGNFTWASRALIALRTGLEVKSSPS